MYSLACFAKNVSVSCIFSLVLISKTYLRSIITKKCIKLTFISSVYLFFNSLQIADITSCIIEICVFFLLDLSCFSIIESDKASK